MAIAMHAYFMMPPHAWIPYSPSAPQSAHFLLPCCSESLVIHFLALSSSLSPKGCESVITKLSNFVTRQKLILNPGSIAMLKIYCTCALYTALAAEARLHDVIIGNFPNNVSKKCQFVRYTRTDSKITCNIYRF